MTTAQPQCDQCGRPAHDGAYVCPACTAALANQLVQVAAVAGEAWVAIARQARIGGGGGGRDDAPLPVDLDAAQRHEAAVGELLGWARHVAEGQGRSLPLKRPGEHPLARLARWLTGQLDWLRRRPEGPEAYAGIGDACRTVVRIVDRPPARWYAGICAAQTMDGLCQEELRPVAGARTARCQCGAVHDLDSRRAWLLDQVEDTWLTAAQCAHALTALGVACTPAMVRGYAHRGRLAAHPELDPMGNPRYRVGSVRELVEERGGARKERAAA